MAPLRVLVVDDDPAVRQMLKRWLENWDYTVCDAPGATGAMAVMSAEPASIVLCDIRMPGHDGFWLVDRIHQTWPETAIIMITGLDDLQTVVKARREGAVDYVNKPFDKDILRQALERAKAALNSPTTDAA
jgi:DNA-binding NtrC family response regulator